MSLNEGCAASFEDDAFFDTGFLVVAVLLFGFSETSALLLGLVAAARLEVGFAARDEGFFAGEGVFVLVSAGGGVSEPAAESSGAGEEGADIGDRV
jgi:hypothetical protein